MCRGPRWQYEYGSLDEVYLDGQLVLYPLEADEYRGWVSHLAVNPQTAMPFSDKRQTVAHGRVEIVRAFEDDFLDEEADDHDELGPI